jgi:hypothetical protein
MFRFVVVTFATAAGIGCAAGIALGFGVAGAFLVSACQ